ncbi:DUF6512 family protein [Thermatribacter velox]|uniref:DUF6512 family protein n=1 Tax=Thermatribacter velox TaxID=3039681 RepID=A0ABZ2YFM5_9BACT
MNTLGKVLLYLGIYALLHFAYEVTGIETFKPISGVDESVFEHLKIGFYAYFFASIIEYFLMRRKKLLSNFWTSRMFATIFVPWSIVIIWYLAPALIGKFGLQAELTWALTVTFLSGIIARQVEKALEFRELPTGFGLSVLVLFVVALVFFSVFTYQKPWIDLFVDPLTLGSH